MESPSGIQQPSSAETTRYNNVNLRLIFEAHEIRNPDINRVRTKTTQLAEEMCDIFKKDQQNFLFFECAYQSKELPNQARLIKEGYEKYGSIILGFCYSLLSPDQQKQADKEKLLTFFEKGYPVMIKNPSDAYNIAKYAAMDELVKEDFSITPIFEDSTGLNKEVEERRIISAFAKGEDYYSARKADPRNSKVVDQIVEIADNSTSSQNQTNILLVMGTDHNGILELLPTDLQARSNATSEINEVLDPIRKAFMGFLSSVAKKEPKT